MVSMFPINPEKSLKNPILLCSPNIALYKPVNFPII
ncbi:MAG: hypothetical protein AMDU4_FER2C00238G0030 [Ferroplasma sp. Type II]|nr:MAG: hypothetical protein AMDU4_FER2C00238G0030 [Ferroplasma sp. Type II]